MTEQVTTTGPIGAVKPISYVPVRIPAWVGNQPLIKDAWVLHPQDPELADAVEGAQELVGNARSVYQADAALFLRHLGFRHMDRVLRAAEQANEAKRRIDVGHLLADKGGDAYRGTLASQSVLVKRNQGEAGLLEQEAGQLADLLGPDELLAAHRKVLGDAAIGAEGVQYASGTLLGAAQWAKDTLDRCGDKVRRGHIERILDRLSWAGLLIRVLPATGIEPDLVAADPDQTEILRYYFAAVKPQMVREILARLKEILPALEKADRAKVSLLRKHRRKAEPDMNTEGQPFFLVQKGLVTRKLGRFLTEDGDAWYVLQSGRGVPNKMKIRGVVTLKRTGVGANRRFTVENVSSSELGFWLFSTKSLAAAEVVENAMRTEVQLAIGDGGDISNLLGKTDTASPLHWGLERLQVAMQEQLAFERENAASLDDAVAIATKDPLVAKLYDAQHEKEAESHVYYYGGFTPTENNPRSRKYWLFFALRFTTEGDERRVSLFVPQGAERLGDNQKLLTRPDGPPDGLDFLRNMLEKGTSAEFLSFPVWRHHLLPQVKRFYGQVAETLSPEEESNGVENGEAGVEEVAEAK